MVGNDAAIGAACADFGITRLPSYQVAEEVAQGWLVPLLEGFELAPMPIHIINRSGLRSPAKVRAFVDLMANRLRASVTLDLPGDLSPQLTE